MRCLRVYNHLTVVPKTENFQIHNSDFARALRYRLFLHQKDLVEGTVCDGCKRKVILDPTGHHLVSGCASFGKRTQMHDALAYEASFLISYCGLRNIREELGCFREAHPECGKRPDITVFNPVASDNLVDANGRIPKLILDFQITSPLPGSQQGVFSAMTPYMADKADNMAGKAFTKKNSDYKRIAEDNGLSFLPIIFETTGRIHPKALEFFSAIADHASQVKRIDKGIIFAFMMNRLSCVLQKHMAGIISSRVNTINGHLCRVASRHYSLSNDHVSTHERFRSRGHDLG